MKKDFIPRLSVFIMYNVGVGFFSEWCDIRTHDDNEKELDKVPERNTDHFRVSYRYK